MQNCIFCKIIRREAPGYILYEDESIIAFLDINPVSEGHLLVVPKEHYENIFEAPETVVAKINVVCKKMAELCKNKLGVTGVNILNASGIDAQQSVFHLHYHVVPRAKDDKIDLWFPENPDMKANLENTHKKLID